MQTYGDADPMEQGETLAHGRGSVTARLDNRWGPSRNHLVRRSDAVVEL
jgi:hypothetical protein